MPQIYLRPKQFEYFGTSSIYTLIGVGFFKRFVPTTGDLARRMRGISQLKYRRQELVSDLYNLEVYTRTMETRHWIGMVLFIAIALVLKAEYSVFDYLLVSALFLIVNVYPILLQRHNRIRILNLLALKGHPSPYINRT
jgi:glycosyl-4,4'-diaponeurosporenoate acyltransferase